MKTDVVNSGFPQERLYTVITRKKIIELILNNTGRFLKVDFFILLMKTKQGTTYR